MKDKQTPPPSGQPSIPVLSPFLHVISMTAVVYLRSAFGFAYLRPKSVFFAFSWAFVLFSIYAWNEPTVWLEYQAVCLFGIGAITLYWFHLLRAFLRELYHQGEHDQFSGRSHLARALNWFGAEPTPFAEMNLHLWTEPCILLVSGLLLRWLIGERHLSAWLAAAAIAVWIKEAFNYWFQLRQRKRQSDMFEDTGETMDASEPMSTSADPPKPTRVPRRNRGTAP